MTEIQVYRMAGTHEQSLILHALSKGVPIDLARDFAGLSQPELDSLISYNPEFKRAIRQITAGSTLELLATIRTASEPTDPTQPPRGDWKAAAWLLERSPQTREAFNQKVEVRHVDIRDLVRSALLDAENHDHHPNPHHDPTTDPSTDHNSQPAPSSTETIDNPE